MVSALEMERRSVNKSNNDYFVFAVYLISPHKCSISGCFPAKKLDKNRKAKSMLVIFQMGTVTDAQGWVSN